MTRHLDKPIPARSAPVRPGPSEGDAQAAGDPGDHPSVPPHTAAPTLAGDASTTQAEASPVPQSPSTGSNPSDAELANPAMPRRARGRTTGPVTRIAKVFGAGTLVLGLLLVSVGGGAAATRAAATAASPNSLMGRVRSPLIVPPSTKGYAAMTATPTGQGAWFVEARGAVRAAGDARGNDDVVASVLDPAVDIAAASDRGYWVVSAWGRVMPRGDAPRLGSMRLEVGARQIVAIAANPDGEGYWLATNDGVVAAFGSSRHWGDARRSAVRDGVPLTDVIDIAVTPSGNGYFLVTRTGRVFAFGDARQHGQPAGFVGRDVVGIAADSDGSGYWIALDTGAVLAYRAGGNRGGFAAGAVPVIDISARAGKGFWTLQGNHVVDHMHPFLVCTRSHESSHNAPAYDDGYDAINPSGRYRGAYQFSRSTWDSTARHFERFDLVGVDPATASVVDQDLMALHLYRWQGADPWLGRCAGE